MDVRSRRTGFTLVEMLVVIAIIATLAGMLVLMLADARQDSNRMRTAAQIRRIDAILLDYWEEVGVQPLSTSIPATNNLADIRLAKVLAIREAYRMNFPDRIADLAVNPSLILPTATWKSYQVRVRVNAENKYGAVTDVDIYGTDPLAGNGFWSASFQEAECLYLILSGRVDEDGNMLRFFSSSEIGDVDDDGQFEILDSWGQPINFIRFAAGFASPRQSDFPDPLDPFQVDPRWRNANPADDPAGLFPLVFSGGPDEIPGIGLPGSYVSPTYGLNDPYDRQTTLGDPVGTRDLSRNGDDIDNHWDIR